jgi:thioredoxin reductase
LFKEVSGRYYPDADDLVEYLRRFAEAFGLNVQPGVDVTRVSKGEDGFVLADRFGRSFRARRLIVATGLTRPNVPPIPGVELTEGYFDMTVDPDDFAGQRVLVIGKGNSGFETANNLVETAAVIHVASPESIRMAWQTHFVGHLRAINNDFLDTYQLKSQNGVLDAAVERIERDDEGYVVTLRYSHARGETEQLRYDRVLACTGFRFDDSIFDATCPVEMTIDGRFPRMTSTWESTSTPDLYFAGVLMYSRSPARATSGFIHGFRYNIRALHRLLEVRHHGGQWPRRTVDARPAALAGTLIERINRTSALWQQFGFLCDLVVPCGEDSAAVVHEEIPLDHVAESGLAAGGRYLTLTLEFGPQQANPFRVPRDPRPERAAESTFLHPIVRYHEAGQLVAEHHVLENLGGEWRDEAAHVRPLVAFLTEHLASQAAASALIR